MKLHHTVRETLHGSQAEGHMAVPAGYQRNAIANKSRDDGNDELVNCSFVKKGANDVTAAHHPDVLPCCLSEALGEVANGLSHKLDTGRKGIRRWVTRKD